MSRVQVIAIAIILGINALDGYDVLAVTYALPGIGAEWGVQRAALGVTISAGLLGMALGAFLLTGLADIFGRRPVTLIFLALMTAGMLASAAAPGIGTLMVCRLVTGLGIGGMIPVLNVTAGEHANARRRNLAVAIAAAGFAVGGMVGGSIAALLLQYFGWRSLFIFGGLASAVAFILVVFCVPESIEFLIARQRPDSLQRVNRNLARMGRSPVASLPAPEAAPKVPLARIFAGELLRPTVAITAAYLLTVMTFYFVMSWIPQIARDMGGSPSQGAAVSALASGFGVIGTIALGQFAPRLGLGRLTLATVLGSAAMTVVIGVVPADLALFAAAAAAAGLVLFAAFTGIYALVVQCFPVEVRATAAGFVVGFGRIGAALSPLVSGLMFGLGFDRSIVAGVMGLSAFLAALAIASVTMQVRRSPAVAQV